jgi:tRNA nucleotidyltransferase (CCA-adding enzyme)
MIVAMRLVSPSELSQRLRELPAAAPLLGALGAEPAVHVVGGTVRDLLRSAGAAEHVDLDLLVEGDAIAVARRLAGALGGELVVHDRFGTATVRAAGHAYDLAPARTETYARPGALPDVQPGTLAQDLLRRDFTVNAVALGLDGRLDAAPRALEDLEAGLLRVLHGASFLDDPTRLLRLVRYATRLGFGVEDETRALMDGALAAGALRTVTPARVGAELRLLLREPSAVQALAWVAAWDDAPVAGMAFDEPLAERACALLAGRERGAVAGEPRADRAGHASHARLAGEGGGVEPRARTGLAATHGAHGRRDLLLLAAACLDVPPGTLAARLDALDFPARDRDTVVAAAGGARRVAARLAESARPSEIAAALAGAPVELAALAGALGPEAPARRWIGELRHVRLAIGGEDLLAAGVPQGEAIGIGLAAALCARLDGDAGDRDAQLAAALAAVADA